MNYKKAVRYLLLVIVIMILLIGGKYLWWIYSPSVIIEDPKENYINIPTGSAYIEVRNIIADRGLVKKIEAFDWVADKKNYHNYVIPGHYVLEDGMNNNDLVNLLRSGEQTPVDLIFNNIGSLEELAQVVASQIEPDSSGLINLLNNDNYISQFDFDHKSLMGAFVPNTYEFYWNTSSKGFFKRMIDEYKKFWTEERKNKAKAIGLTVKEVSTLASIVDGETIKKSEKPAIAGVYLNRLEKGIRLQADPTVKFALKDSSRKRILKYDLYIDSPYNTYRVAGLPPGPISIPSVSGLEAVLNADDHSYLYLCARADMSGFHHFSETLREHIRYARKYRRELDKLKIMK